MTEETTPTSPGMQRAWILAGYLCLIAIFVAIHSLQPTGLIHYLLFGAGFGIYNAFNFRRQPGFSTAVGIASIIAEADITHIIEKARWIAFQAGAEGSWGRRQEGGQFILLGIFAGEIIFLLVSLIGSRIIRNNKATIPDAVSEDQKKNGESIIMISSYILLLAIYIPLHVLWADALDGMTGYILFGILAGILGGFFAYRKKIYFIIFPAAIALIEGILAAQWTTIVLGPFFAQTEREGGYVEYDPYFPGHSALISAGIALGLSLVIFLAAKLIGSSQKYSEAMEDH